MSKQNKHPAQPEGGPDSPVESGREKIKKAARARPEGAAKASGGAQEKKDSGGKEAKTRGWPFAPGSQLGQQVAKPWTPKPVYRFNQR